MREIILIEHTSLDGFVADENGNLNVFKPSEESLQFVCNIVQNADAAILGRVTYQLFKDYWTDAYKALNATAGEITFSNWYNAANKIIVSKSLANYTEERTTVLSNNIIDEVIEIKKQQDKSMIVFGSPSVAQLLMQYNLIDTYWIFINSVIFGKGLSLFKQSENKIDLRLVEFKHLPDNDELAIKYVKHK